MSGDSQDSSRDRGDIRNNSNNSNNSSIDVDVDRVRGRKNSIFSKIFSGSRTHSHSHRGDSGKSTDTLDYDEIIKAAEAHMQAADLATMAYESGSDEEEEDEEEEEEEK